MIFSLRLSSARYGWRKTAETESMCQNLWISSGIVMLLLHFATDFSFLRIKDGCITSHVRLYRLDMQPAIANRVKLELLWRSTSHLVLTPHSVGTTYSLPQQHLAEGFSCTSTSDAFVYIHLTLAYPSPMVWIWSFHSTIDERSNVAICEIEYWS